MPAVAPACAGSLIAYCSRLVGVDLSQRMLDRPAAAAYTTSRGRAELTGFLRLHACRLRCRSLGRHAGLLRPARSRVPCCFRCTQGSRNSFVHTRGRIGRRSAGRIQLNPHGRYSHSGSYVAACAVGMRVSEASRSSARAPDGSGFAGRRVGGHGPETGGRAGSGAIGRGRKRWHTATTTRLMEITTPLGKDLLFHRMNAREELGRLSEFEIDLLSPRNDIKFADILSKNVTVKLELANKSDRYFNGFVTRFSQIGMRGRYHLYHASVRPWLWFLTRTSDCRIFQKIKVPHILKQVFNDHKIADTKFELTGTYREWEYCVQYRETDFNFVSRLMEQEGIYYYFKHVDGRHTMVLTDSYSGHSPFPGHEHSRSFLAIGRGPEQEGISDWTFSSQVRQAIRH